MDFPLSYAILSLSVHSQSCICITKCVFRRLILSLVKPKALPQLLSPLLQRKKDVLLLTYMLIFLRMFETSPAAEDVIVFAGKHEAHTLVSHADPDKFRISAVLSVQCPRYRNFGCKCNALRLIILDQICACQVITDQSLT